MSHSEPTPASSYTIFYPMKEGSIPFGPTYNLPSSRKKFLHKSVPHPESESTITVAVTSTKSTTAEGPTVPKPQTLPEDYDAKIESFLHFLNSLGSEAETTNDVTADE